ncbi:hypothetical protein ACFQ48_04655 [Hymenobacter caeli]|uniref:Uncharacterized protein n=1 Tax=Hymenobacter caeli TaxID=2735894 RepID=A0ABX2FS69_9BACT|nr:hypothetical protein [Hymenobacter caeli]NRT19250.1 hypothetical protein [Hymenobacter caeli]
MEDYAAKMQAKSAAELRQYVGRYAEYRDDAVLAALAELSRRGLPAPEEAALRPALEVAVAQQQAAEAKAAAAAPRPGDPAAADGLELYSQGTIVLFSMLFSMLAGGILLGLNLHRLRRTGALARLVAFVLALSVARGLALAWALTQFSNNLLVLAFLPFLFDVAGTVVYLAWFWPRYVGTQEYRSRSWLLPLVLCLALSFALRPLIAPMLVKSGLVPPTAPAKK